MRNINEIKKDQGFTLIEAVVTIMVVSVIGLILTGILSSSFTGSTKTQLVGNIKQNGQVALNIMENSIKFAQAIVCPAVASGSTSATGKVLVVQNKNGNLIRFAYIDPSGSNNGKVVQDSPTVNNTLSANTYCDTTIIPLSNPQNLTDINNLSVKNTTLFTVLQDIGASPAVNINLDLGAPETAKTTFSEQIPTVNFRTKVQVK